MHIDHTARLVAVQGVGGGSGATVLAAALGVRAAARHRTCLVDLDEAAGGLDVVLGVESEPGLRWCDLAGAEGEIVAASVRARLPVVGDGGPCVLSHGRHRPCLPHNLPHRTLKGLRHEFDLIVVDLPPHLDPPNDTDDHVVVMRANVPAVAAAGALAGRRDRSIAATPSAVRPVVRDASRSSAEAVAASLGWPSALSMRSDRGLEDDLERGVPPGARRRSSLARAADHLLRALAVGSEPTSDDAPGSTPHTPPAGSGRCVAGDPT